MSLKKGIALITGGSGFIGSHLTKRLVEEGFFVISTYSKNPNLYRAFSIRENVNLCKLNLINHVEVESLFQKNEIKYVFHLAAHGVQEKLDRARDVIEVNTLATTTLAQISIKYGVEKFVYLGSAFEYKAQDFPINESALLSPLSFYGATKAAGWFLLDYLYRIENLPLITLRPFSVYGPGEDISKFIPYVITSALSKNKINLTEGLQIRDYLFVSDAIEAILKAFQNPDAIGETYNLGAGLNGASAIKDIALKILDLCEVSRKLCIFGTANRNRREPPFLVADYSKAQKELGWSPRYSLEKGIMTTIDWYRDFLDQSK